MARERVGMCDPALMDWLKRKTFSMAEVMAPIDSYPLILYNPGTRRTAAPREKFEAKSNIIIGCTFDLSAITDHDTARLRVFLGYKWFNNDRELLEKTIHSRLQPPAMIFASGPLTSFAWSVTTPDGTVANQAIPVIRPRRFYVLKTSDEMIREFEGEGIEYVPPVVRGTGVPAYRSTDGPTKEEFQRLMKGMEDI